MLSEGRSVPPDDAFRLRTWALTPEDAMLSLEEIALRIISQEPEPQAHRWFVICKTCKTGLADQDSSFTYDPKHPQWRNPQWKSDIKCPECHQSHEYTSADLQMEASE